MIPNLFNTRCWQVLDLLLAQSSVFNFQYMRFCFAHSLCNDATWFTIANQKLFGENQGSGNLLASLTGNM
jgi:hypothetical protein